MSTLDVPGARLYYETYGRGSLMLMIPGANGTADIFRGVAKCLEAEYTVVAYDRRGFSRSRVDAPLDPARRLEVDADDARRLMEHLSDEPGIVFGSSSGGVVALTVLTEHPSVVRVLVPFEPAAFKQLSDGQTWLDFFSEVYDLYRRSGIQPALKAFRERAFAESDRQVMARATDPSHGEHVSANAAYWFEHELRQYPAAMLDVDALKARADRILPVVGRASRGYPTYEVNVELGKKLGRPVIEMPGGHVGYATHPAEFATGLCAALRRQADDGMRRA
jgi:pimeloyl-ACP methyl ester carboxylesterase